MFSDGIYNRTTGASTMSQSAYVRCIALFTLLEGAVVAVGSTISYSWEFNWWLLIGTFLVSILGIFMFTGSSNPVTSGLGVTIMAGALGLMLGPVVAHYDMSVVLQAVVLTGTVMVVMSVMGLMFPQVFRGLGPWVLPVLTLLLVGLFSEAILVAVGVPYGNMSTVHYVLTWVGIVIFTALVAYDWARALDMPHNLDNAIDASGGILLDGVNLFIRILELLGSADSD